MSLFAFIVGFGSLLGYAIYAFYKSNQQAEALNTTALTTADLLKKVRKIEIKSKGLSNQIFSGEYH
ncbi:MAG: hypothetical protein ACPGXL_06215, partial [Chitinophagales bacterium]